MSTTTITNELQESLQTIAKKSGKTFAEVKQTYEEAHASLPASLSEKQKIKYALKKTNAALSVNTRSDAIAFEGIIIGGNPVRDIMKRIRTEAINAYTENAEEAKRSGLVRVEDGDIVVLDNRPTLPDGSDNPKFGKPRPKHMFVRELIVAVKQPSEKSFRAGTLTLWNEKANLKIPRGSLVGFKALGGINEETGEYELRSSKDTAFEIKDASLPREELVRIIDDAFINHYVELGKCEDHFEEVKGTPKAFNDYVVTEGVLKFNPSFAQKDGANHRIILDDDSLPEGSQPVTCWVPSEQKDQIQFGRGSIVTVIGRLSMKPGWDSKEKKPTEELQLQINALAVFGRPGLTTPINSQSDEF